MTTDYTEDLVIRRLIDLPALAPDGARALQTRARCRARLERQQRHARRSLDRSLMWTVGRVLIGTLSAVYLSAAVNYLVELRSLGS